ncbi:MAG: hypothetical protein JWM17_143, partial [Actinobacteria bacterium]|nr:hypothetical protein [Actinomycetota bacterium]
AVVEGGHAGPGSLGRQQDAAIGHLQPSARSQERQLNGSVGRKEQLLHVQVAEDRLNLLQSAIACRHNKNLSQGEQVGSEIVIDLSGQQLLGTRVPGVVTV